MLPLFQIISVLLIILKLHRLKYLSFLYFATFLRYVQCLLLAFVSHFDNVKPPSLYLSHMHQAFNSKHSSFHSEHQLSSNFDLLQIRFLQSEPVINPYIFEAPSPLSSLKNLGLKFFFTVLSLYSKFSFGISLWNFHLPCWCFLVVGFHNHFVVFLLVGFVRVVCVPIIGFWMRCLQFSICCLWVNCQMIVRILKECQP